MNNPNDSTARSLSKAERKAIDAAREKLDDVQKAAVIRLFRRLLNVLFRSGLRNKFYG